MIDLIVLDKKKGFLTKYLKSHEQLFLKKEELKDKVYIPAIQCETDKARKLQEGLEKPKLVPVTDKSKKDVVITTRLLIQSVAL